MVFFVSVYRGEAAIASDCMHVRWAELACLRD
jgi:hypothetical protein